MGYRTVPSHIYRAAACLAGTVVVLAVAVGSLVASQPGLAPSVQQALAALTSGVTPFSTVGVITSGYINWGFGRGSTGYGLRDNAGAIEGRNSGGTWYPIVPTARVSSSVSATTAVATTAFSATAAGRYDVVAYISNLGTAYTAFSTVVSDGTNARLSSSNGANLTITLSGTDVQVTQTSGSTQTVAFAYQQLR